MKLLGLIALVSVFFGLGDGVKCYTKVDGSNPCKCSFTNEVGCIATQYTTKALCCSKACGGAAGCITAAHAQYGNMYQQDDFAQGMHI